MLQFGKDKQHSFFSTVDFKLMYNGLAKNK